jgi:serine/threonine protein phosphatase PrpC
MRSSSRSATRIEAIRAAAVAQDKLGMGATLTAILIDGQDAWIAEVGDSRAYLLRDGKWRQLTRDQSLVQMLDDAGTLTPEEARHSPQKNVILQAIGTAPTLVAAIARLLLRRAGGRYSILAGKAHQLGVRDAAKATAGNADRAGDPARDCSANGHGGSDNITAIIAHVCGDASERTRPVSTSPRRIRSCRFQEDGPAQACSAIGWGSRERDSCA